MEQVNNSKSIKVDLRHVNFNNSIIPLYRIFLHNLSRYPNFLSDDARKEIYRSNIQNGEN